MSIQIDEIERVQGGKAIDQVGESICLLKSQTLKRFAKNVKTIRLFPPFLLF